LISLISKFEGDSSTLMNHWKSLSYGGRKSSDEKNMKVGAKDQSTGKKFEVNLIKWEGNWQVDSLFPIPVGESPNVAFQQLLNAARAGDHLRILNTFSDKLLAKIVANDHANISEVEMNQFSQCSISSWRVDPDDSNKGWVDLNYMDSSGIEIDHKVRHKMVREHGSWRITGEFGLTSDLE